MSDLPPSDLPPGNWPPTVRTHDFRPVAPPFREAAIAGLSKPRKSLPARYFYDDRGSALFQRICGLPEYYPTRTELALTRAAAGDIAALIGPGHDIVEFGCGSSAKVRALLDAIEAPGAYVAIDISKAALMALARELAAAYPKLEIVAVCADFTVPLTLPATNANRSARRVGYFPGSTIGNFTPPAAEEFLRGAATLVGPGGGFIVGIDLKKDVARLEAAYNDGQGITARFNLNMLERMNRELGTGIDVTRFRHRAFYNAGAGRIEMHLESLAHQEITVDGQRFAFTPGETIHTENSYKYSIPDFQALASRAGFQPAQVWSDDDNLFALHYLSVPEA